MTLSNREGQTPTSGNGRRYRARTAREKAFCRHHVAGHNGKESAILAGVARSHAKQYAYTRVQRQAILDGIERLCAVHANAVGQALTTALNGSQPTSSEQVPLELRKTIDAETAAGLDRGYCIAGLYQKAEIALGWRPVTISKLKERRGADGRIEGFDREDIEVFRPDAAASNQALAKLAKLVPDKVLRDGDGKDVMTPKTRTVIESFRTVSAAFRQRLSLDEVGVGSTGVVDIEPSENGAKSTALEPSPGSLGLPENWRK
jgi:hypothetical protein